MLQLEPKILELGGGVKKIITINNHMGEVNAALDIIGKAPPVLRNNLKLEPDGTLVATDGVALIIIKNAFADKVETPTLIHLESVKFPRSRAPLVVYWETQAIIKGGVITSFTKRSVEDYPQYKKYLECHKEDLRFRPTMSIRIDIIRAYEIQRWLAKQNRRAAWYFYSDNLLKYDHPNKDIQIYLAPLKDFNPKGLR